MHDTVTILTPISEKKKNTLCPKQYYRKYHQDLRGSHDGRFISFIQLCGVSSSLISA